LSLRQKPARQLSQAKSVRNFLIEKRRLFSSELLKGKQVPPMIVEKDFRDFKVIYDGYWTRFRSKSYDWDNRCRFEEIMRLPSLPECARYCWKLLMFRRRPQEVWESVVLLLPLLSQDEIQSFKHNGDRLFDAQREGYVIVIYTWGEDQRDKLKQKLHRIGFTSVPWRRGCKAFEQRFGPWRTWFKYELSL